MGKRIQEIKALIPEPSEETEGLCFLSCNCIICICREEKKKRETFEKTEVSGQISSSLPSHPVFMTVSVRGLRAQEMSGKPADKMKAR